MEDIASRAEKAIKSLVHKNNRGDDVLDITTTQIRKFLTAVNVLNNKVAVYSTQTGNTETLSDELAAEIKYLKVKIIYQIAKAQKHGSNPVKDFADKANLITTIDCIGNSMKKYHDFAKYMEALVAYHKYYGGKEK